MSYAIFGAGRSGDFARSFLTPERQACFVDNFQAGKEKYGLPIVSLETYQKEYANMPLVIASERYWMDMERDVLRAGITRYFVFRERDMADFVHFLPGYYLYRKHHLMGYDEILANYRVYQYSKLAIVGTNAMLPYLLLEIMEQAPESEIVGIVDVHGRSIGAFGVPAMTLEEAQTQADMLIMNVPRQDDCGVRETLWDADVPYLDLYDIDKFIPVFHHPELARFKDIHKGERCFIIGNGPSLRMEDLDTLAEHHEISFGVNRIYRGFPHTKWRPTYYCMSDDNGMPDFQANLWQLDMPIFLADMTTCMPWNTGKQMPRVDCANVFHFCHDYCYPSLPAFSMDITEGTYLGCTVLYDIALPLAMYMGFQTIYLIGVDHHFAGYISDPANHFCADYASAKELEIEKSLPGKYVYTGKAAGLAYQKARRVAEKKGVHIYNATRGGKLEVFERVNFDELFT